VTARRLSAWAVSHRRVFDCCSPELSIKDDYNGGATFVAFLAAQFGESIHARLLENSATTFFEALTMETKRCSRQQLFALFENWLDRGAPSRGSIRLDRHDCIPEGE